MSRMQRSKKENSILENSKRSVLQIIFSRTMFIMVLIVVQFAYLIARMYTFVEHIPIILGGELAIVAIMLAIILNSHDNPTIKLSWCFLIGLFPLLGCIVYFVVKYDLGYRVTQKRILVTEECSRKYVSKQNSLLYEIKQKDEQTYRIAEYLRKYSGSSVSKNNQIKYFKIGEEMFEEMLKQLETATEYIYLEYFMISHGKMWDSILEILKKKAKEGVDVRILYDGSCSVYLLPYKYPEQIQKLGIKCQMFSPPVPFLSTHYNNRDHRKIMVIDGRVAFTGGVNLCDEYININSPCGHWKDVGIMLEGDAVYDFTLMFMQMWSAATAKTTKDIYFPNMQKYIAKTSYFPSDKTFEKEETDGYVIPYADNPVDDENVGKNVYIDILNQAKDYVYIMTPYLILDGEMLNAILFAAKRGIDVRIILPHIPDKWYAFALARENYKTLLGAGVKVYEYTPGFVHAKVFVADGERAVVGSMNLDYRSLYWHYECAVYMYKVPVIKEIYKDFMDTQAMCEQVTEENVKKISPFSKGVAFVLKIVAPLL